MLNKDICDAIGLREPLFEGHIRLRILRAQPLGQHHFAACMPHRFGFGAPGALASLMREMQLSTLSRSTAQMDDSPAIGTAQRTLMRPALEPLQSRLFRDNGRIVGTICNKHSAIR